MVRKAQARTLGRMTVKQLETRYKQLQREEERAERILYSENYITKAHKRAEERLNVIDREKERTRSHLTHRQKKAPKRQKRKRLALFRRKKRR